jgi:hypothetical protein
MLIYKLGQVPCTKLIKLQFFQSPSLIVITLNILAGDSITEKRFILVIVGYLNEPNLSN